MTITITTDANGAEKKEGKAQNTAYVQNIRHHYVIFSHVTKTNLEKHALSYLATFIERLFFNGKQTAEREESILQKHLLDMIEKRTHTST